MCEAYLGVIPDLDLFHYFYMLKLSGKVAAGEASLHLGNKRTNLYIAFSAMTS